MPLNFHPAAVRGEVHKADDDSTGRNPEAGEAACVNALKARAVEATRIADFIEASGPSRAERPNI
jgi:hypothetical protein